ncbi:hypothetical protein BOTBODRAFT_448417 [Botryobasidium botryosum FD-172 SS1]|uniref:Uncharacterized protein n=1 Tax=Botryobasidium botryosum (strain FD-172 SS1) TaxID=930990 RepID=A0A067M788_BOTB1|nr:hypothetical protein BOTBODRAFT_448417 [Botryobasidium botryosum FD-172 SS1]
MRLLAKATAAATFFSTAAALSGHPSRPPDPNIAAAGYFTHSSPREGPLPSCPVDSSPAININALYKNLTLFGSTRSADDGDNINTLARLASPPAPSLASPTATYSAASVPTTTTTTTTVAPRAVYTNINIASYIASYLASSAGPTPPPRSLAAPSPTPAPAPAPTPGPGPGPAPGPTSTLGSPPVHGNTRPAPGSSSVPVARPVAGPCTCPAVAAPALTEEQKHFWVYASFGIKIDKIRSELYACRAPPARLPREIHLAWRATELRIRAMRAAMPAPPPENVSSEIQVLNAVSNHNFCVYALDSHTSSHRTSPRRTPVLLP